MVRFYVAALVGASLLSSCSTAAFANVEEEFEQTVALSADGEFEISNVNGSIEIAVWDREEVEIRATRRASNDEALRDVEVIVEGSSDRVDVGTKLPKGWGKSGSVAYRITLPATVEVEASTVNGRVDIEGVSGEMDLKSVNGAIEANGASGAVDASTVNGRVTVRYEGIEAGAHKFKAVNGALRVYLPASVAGTFHASSVNGGIETDFPLEVKKARFGPQRSLDGELGSGDEETSFSFNTVNGSIRIRNAASVAENR